MAEKSGHTMTASKNKVTPLALIPMADCGNVARYTSAIVNIDLIPRYTRRKAPRISLHK